MSVKLGLTLCTHSSCPALADDGAVNALMNSALSVLHERESALSVSALMCVAQVLTGVRSIARIAALFQKRSDESVIIQSLSGFYMESVLFLY